MKVTGLARRRMKQQRGEGDPMERQLRVWPSADADDTKELPGKEVAAATDVETLSSEETGSSSRQAASTTLSKPPSVYDTQPPELSDLDPHWVFEYGTRVWNTGQRRALINKNSATCRQIDSFRWRHRRIGQYLESPSFQAIRACAEMWAI